MNNLLLPLPAGAFYIILDTLSFFCSYLYTRAPLMSPDPGLPPVEPGEDHCLMPAGRDETCTPHLCLDAPSCA